METNPLLQQQIEAILFFKGEPMSTTELAGLLQVSEDEVRHALKELQESLHNRGVRLMKKDHEVALATAPDMSDLIEAVRKRELSKDIGKAGLETLAVILYKGSLSRSEIDYIRGVNSTFILRNLLIRGLIERIQNPTDNRSYLYRPTFELLSFLGISTIEELPDFESVQAQLQAFADDIEKAEEEIGAEQEREPT